MLPSVRLNTLQPAKGFTLLELLVVIVIIAVIAGLSGITPWSNNSQRIETETQRLYQVMRLLADQALYEQKEWGISLNTEGYQVKRYNPDTGVWEIEEEATGAYKSYKFDEPLNAELITDGAYKLQTSNSEEYRSEDDEETDENLPQLVFLSSGETTAFDLTLSEQGSDSSFAGKILSDGSGRLHMEFVSPDEV